MKIVFVILKIVFTFLQFLLTQNPTFRRIPFIEQNSVLRP